MRDWFERSLRQGKAFEQSIQLNSVSFRSIQFNAVFSRIMFIACEPP